MQESEKDWIKKKNMRKKVVNNIFQKRDFSLHGYEIVIKHANNIL